MKPSPARTVYFGAAIFFFLIVPFYVLTSLVSSEFIWQRFFCDVAWYSNWETILWVMVASFLHHQFWFGRHGPEKGGESFALNLIVHGVIVFPALILWKVGFSPSSPSDGGTDVMVMVIYGFFVFWLVMAVFIAHLRCLWPDPQITQSALALRRSLAIFGLSSISIGLGFLALWIHGPCYGLSML